MPERSPKLRRAVTWVVLLPITVPVFAVGGAAYGAWIMLRSAFRDLSAALKRPTPAQGYGRPGLSLVSEETRHA